MSTSIKVNSLQINTFRGIKHLELEFSPHTNVFVGINGVGKTTILDCLAILLSHLMNQISGTGERLYTIPLVVYYPVNRAVLDVDIALNITQQPDFNQLTAL
jgi:ABC-type cobalamin/Fe3+-siderophores transport system ATPase subunit